jgi:hypothetical protein
LVGRAAVVSAADRPVLPRDLARTIAYAGVNLTPPGRARRAASRARGSRLPRES